MSDSKDAFEAINVIPDDAEFCEKHQMYKVKQYRGIITHPVNDQWESFQEGAEWQASRQALDCEVVGNLTVEHFKNNPAMQNVDYEHAGDVLKPGRYKLYTHPASADVQDTCTLNLDPGKAILDHHEKVFGPFPAAYNGNDAVSDICSAIDAHYKSYTHPASAVPDVEYIRALQDACDIIHADANTEENYASFCRIGAVLVKLRAGQEQGQ